MRRRSWHFSLLQRSRFYSVPYLTAVALCGLWAAGAPGDTRALVVALLLPGSFAIGVAAWNDLAHLAADRRAGRGRTTDGRLLIGTGAVGSGAALLLASLGGSGVVVGLLMSLLAGGLYAKGKAIPLLANGLRGLTTVTFVLGIASMGAAPRHAIGIAAGFALLDTAGNIWGDVRDVQPDRRAGIATIATVRPRLAQAAAILLMALGLAVLAEHTPWLWLCVLPFGLTAMLPPRFQHGYALLLKYLVVMIVGGGLAASPKATLLIALLGSLVVPAAWLYWRMHLEHSETRGDQGTSPAV